MRTIELENVIGAEVMSSDAKVVGTVEGVEIDIKGWRLVALKIGLRRGLEDSIGSKKHLFSVEKVNVLAAEIASISDMVMLRKDMSHMSEMLGQADEGTISAGALIGKSIVCSNGYHIGTVDDVLFRPEEGWSVPYIQARMDKSVIDLIGSRHPFIPSDLAYLRTKDIVAVGDMVIIGMTCDEFTRYMVSWSESILDRIGP